MVQSEKVHCWMFTLSDWKVWLTLAPLNKGSVIIVCYKQEGRGFDSP
jgi:hypothetical protein